MPSASDQLVPGQQISFTLGYSGPALDAAWVKRTLQAWEPFQSRLTLNAVNSAGSGDYQVIATPNAGASSLTRGGVAAAAADTLTQATALATGGFTGTFSVVGLGAGLGTTTFSQQFEQEGGLTLSPLAPTTPGGQNWLAQKVSNLFSPSGSSDNSGDSGGSGSGISWGIVALVVIGAIVALEVID